MHSPVILYLGIKRAGPGRVDWLAFSFDLLAMRTKWAGLNLVKYPVLWPCGSKIDSICIPDCRLVALVRWTG